MILKLDDVVLSENCEIFRDKSGKFLYVKDETNKVTFFSRGNSFQKKLRAIYEENEPPTDEELQKITEIKEPQDEQPTETKNKSFWEILETF